MGVRARVLAEPVGIHPRAGPGLRSRVPGRAEPVPAPAGRRRHAADSAVRGPGALPARAEPVPVALFGRPLRRLLLAGPRAVAGRTRRSRGPAAAARLDGLVARPLGALSVDRQRRPDLVRLRLGVAAARGGLP